MPASHRVICQLWTVVELGERITEGTLCALHLSEEYRQRFIEEYWASMPSDAAKLPDTYLRPANCVAGMPVLPYECVVDDITYMLMLSNGSGFWSTTIPSPSGAVTVIRSDDIIPLITTSKH